MCEWSKKGIKMEWKFRILTAQEIASINKEDVIFLTAVSKIFKAISREQCIATAYNLESIDIRRIGDMFPTVKIWGVRNSEATIINEIPSFSLDIVERTLLSYQADILQAEVKGSDYLLASSPPIVVVEIWKELGYSFDGIELRWK